MGKCIDMAAVGWVICTLWFDGSLKNTGSTICRLPQAMKKKKKDKRCPGQMRPQLNVQNALCGRWLLSKASPQRPTAVAASQHCLSPVEVGKMVRVDEKMYGTKKPQKNTETGVWQYSKCQSNIKIENIALTLHHNRYLSYEITLWKHKERHNMYVKI